MERASRFFSPLQSREFEFHSLFAHAPPSSRICCWTCAPLFPPTPKPDPFPSESHTTALCKAEGEGEGGARRIVGGGGGGNVPHNYCSHFSPLPLARKHLLRKNPTLFFLFSPTLPLASDCQKCVGGGVSTQKVGWGSVGGDTGRKCRQTKRSLYIPSLVSLSLAIGSQTEEEISATH